MKSEKPLMLKDYLKVDSNSDPLDTMRHLIETELRGYVDQRALIRTRPRKALSKLSSLINLDFFLLSCSPRSRSFSKKNQSGSFWKKKSKEEEKFKVKDIVRIESLDSPNSPAASVSSRSISSRWSQSDCTVSDFLYSSNGSSEFLPDVERSPEKTDSKKAADSRRDEKGENEELEQLSPVSVMDFPFEESESLSCFDASLDNIERVKEDLLQKIRRFECLAELAPLNLDERFSAVDTESSGHVSSDYDNLDEQENQQISIENQALNLLTLIKTNLSFTLSDSFENLLTDFFMQELNNCCNNNGKNDDLICSKLVEFVRKWIEGESECWEDRDYRGQMEIGQMEINGRWRCFEQEQGELADHLGFRVWESLLDEVVLELLS